MRHDTTSYLRNVDQARGQVVDPELVVAFWLIQSESQGISLLPVNSLLLQ